MLVGLVWWPVALPAIIYQELARVIGRGFDVFCGEDGDIFVTRVGIDGSFKGGPETAVCRPACVGPVVDEPPLPVAWVFRVKHRGLVDLE